MRLNLHFNNETNNTSLRLAKVINLQFGLFNSMKF